MDLAIALALGILIAFFLYDLVAWVNTVLAIIIGYFIGTIMYNFTVKIFDMDPDELYLITILSCIAITIMFMYIIDSIIIIVTTSLIGAYLALRGLSICLGGFPDETYTSQLILNREFNQLSRVFGGPANAYLMGMILMFIVGLSVQSGIASCLSGSKSEDNNKPIVIIVNNPLPIQEEKIPIKQNEEKVAVPENVAQ